MTADPCTALLLLLSTSHVTMLALENVKFLCHMTPIWYIQGIDHLEIVVLKNIEVPQYYSFPALFFLQPLMKAVKNLSLRNSVFFAIPCVSSSKLSKISVYR